MDVQATNFVKNREWGLALDSYNKLLQKSNNSEQDILTYLLDRSECLYQLGHHESVISDCREILKTFGGKYNNLNEPRTRTIMMRSLFAVYRLAGMFLIL